MVRTDTKLALVALTVATGSLDATAFLRLGGVFASVMTSNLVFVGLAGVRADAELGEHCAVALACYVAGVAIGSAVAPPSGVKSRLGTRRLSALLAAELAVLVVFAVWWAAEHGHPDGATQLIFLGIVTAAMGAQSAVARELGEPGAGTTYLTGALTNLVARAATGQPPDFGAALSIVALVAGAAAGVALLDVAPPVVPVVAITGVTATAVLSWRRHPTAHHHSAVSMSDGTERRS